MCLPSDALLQHLLSYLGFSYRGGGVREGFSYLGGWGSSKAQPLLLTLDEGYLLTAAPLDFERGGAPLGPPAPMHPMLLGCRSAQSIVHQALYLSDLVPLIYFSLPLYNHKGFDLGHT